MHASHPHHRRPARRARRLATTALRADDGQPARGPSRAGARRPRCTAVPGGGEHLRQPPAVPAARGLRPATRARWSATASCCDGPAATSCSRPSEGEMYPEPQTFKVTPPPSIADMLEGEFRPGFFTGVCTVVMKLFQLRAAGRRGVRQEGLPAADGDPAMVRQFALPIEMIAGETVRAPRRPGAVVAQRLPRPERSGPRPMRCRARCARSAAALREGARDVGSDRGEAQATRWPRAAGSPTTSRAPPQPTCCAAPPRISTRGRRWSRSARPAWARRA